MLQVLVPKDLHGFKKVLKTAVLMGAGTAFILAAVYVVIGQKLLGNPDYLTIDSYVFTLSFAYVGLFSVHYFIRRRDISQALMMIFSGAYFLFSGWEDFFVYLIDTDSTMFKELPHLDNGHHIGYWATEVLWFDQVNGTALLATMFTTLFLIYLPGMYLLYKINSKLGPV